MLKEKIIEAIVAGSYDHTKNKMVITNRESITAQKIIDLILEHLPKCKIEGCLNNCKYQGKNEDGSLRYKSTCRKHHSDGTLKYRHRGQGTTLSNRLRFRKPIKPEQIGKAQKLLTKLNTK